MSGKLPMICLYTGDWMKDPALRSVSSAARGLWIDLLCLMFEAPRRGYLELNPGQPLSPKQVSRMTGLSTKEVQKWSAELKMAGVLSVSENGIIFSRRMVRDEDKRLKAKEFGKRGGNPAITNRVNPPDNLDSKAKPTPSISTSTSTSTSELNTPLPPTGGTPQKTPSDEVPPELTELCNWWNRMHARKLVSAGVIPGKPSEAVRKGWKRVQANAELRESIKRLSEIEDRIRESDFCRGGWFRLEKLLGAKNGAKAIILEVLLEGGYRGTAKKKGIDYEVIFKGGDDAKTGLGLLGMLAADETSALAGDSGG